MTDIQGLLGDDADDLLTYTCKGITADQLTLPGGDIVDRVYAQSDRSPQVLRNLQAMFGHGRLADTGYVSILPVDQGIEHSARGVVRAQPRATSTRRTSSSSPSRAAATRWPPPSACSG